MSRIRLALALAALIAIGAAGSAGAWQYKFQDFFDFEDGAIAAGLAKAKKCGPGGKLGAYDYRSFVTSSSGDTEFEVEVRAELSVRSEFRRMKKVEVSARATPDIPPEYVDEAAAALHAFHETVFTRWKPGKLKIRHGTLEMFGNEVVQSGESKTKFEPKPGC